LGHVVTAEALLLFLFPGAHGYCRLVNPAFAEGSQGLVRRLLLRQRLLEEAIGLAIAM